MAPKAPRPFQLGKKQVPQHVVSIVPPVRPQPPNFVNFHVPLTFNKFDLRDYLHNVYGVNALKVRSWVRLAKPKRRDNKPGGMWYRPKADKYMSIKLAETDPFVLPAAPDDLSPWDNKMYDTLEKQRGLSVTLREKRHRSLRKKGDPYKLQSPFSLRDHRIKVLGREAQRLRSGQIGWTNGVELDEKWDGAVEEIRKAEKGLKAVRARTRRELSRKSKALHARRQAKEGKAKADGKVGEKGGEKTKA